VGVCQSRGAFNPALCWAIWRRGARPLGLSNGRIRYEAQTKKPADIGQRTLFEIISKAYF